ncbi:MAG: Transcription attenuator LytR [Candidatus Pacebacteria bacterium GW2011_GWF2_38_9]|nr:MAG: Transcription attenuator LytR [candidate division TM6 bacterium GW2011_GWF2_28_16]KKQ10217.1 MAG: Transcription attenuator LytR [Candidatus Pacebacteria bacterium GW2011_GWF1_36_5]KKQ88823.1 MAG: Transcription attenuator LytR [Candidatus Pacebacteria bacterium GW2011_GWF2_38_9]HAZ73238.1 hypothetical protein [Candidatus Paceibacterota bacterium]
MKQDLTVTLEYKKPSLIFKLILWFFGLLFLSFISLFIYFSIKTNKIIKDFAKAAELSKEEVLDTASISLNQFQDNLNNVSELAQKYNFLILGTDKLSGRDGDPELTDTVMLLQADFKNGKIKTLSLPRDLYVENYQTKINALYFYGKDRYPETPEKFPEEVIAEISNFKADHTIVMGIEDLEKMIDILGGVEIDVPIAFTDPLFPIQDVDVSEITDPKLLYEEVSFKTGFQEMDSSLALKYMRSRHSEGDEGTDEARAQRQQLVLEAIFDKILKTRNPEVFGQLYRFYLDRFAKNISTEEIIQIGTVFIDYISKNTSTEISFEKHQLSIYPDDENGVIFNPPLWQSKQQWIYQIKDQIKFTESINAIFN